jgi:hypothetical protein
MSTVAEAEAQALSIVTSFLSTNYPCGCDQDPDCPGEGNEAQSLLDLLRPVLHRERDLQLAAASPSTERPAQEHHDQRR